MAVSRFERICLRLGPRAHRWGYNVWTFWGWARHPIDYVRTMRRWKVDGQRQEGS